MSHRNAYILSADYTALHRRGRLYNIQAASAFVKPRHVKFELFLTVNVSWAVAPCSLVDTFGGACCLLQVVPGVNLSVQD
jgi:hypothetical protein